MRKVGFMIIASCNMTIVLYIPFRSLCSLEISPNTKGFIILAHKRKEGEVWNRIKETFVA